METIESNIKIALFLGAKFEKDDYGEFGYTFEKPFYKNWHTRFKDDALLFHESWDWLMPVVDKIESLGNGVTIRMDYCIIETDRSYEKGKHETKIIAVYNSVLKYIAFVNMYNDLELITKIYGTK